MPRGAADKTLVAKPTNKVRRRRIRARTIILPLLVVIAVLFGMIAGRFVATTKTLPGVRGLETYRPSLITEVLADDGSVVGEFAVERRILVPYDKISQNFIHAIVAVEDAAFFHHTGVNLVAITRAAYKNFRAGHVVEGGSTITQQLAKLLFLTPEQSLDRKIREALLALQIERHYTKEQILEFYANKIYLNHGVYGVEAGSQYYFDKHAADLSLLEAATLAGIPKSPPAYSPDVHPDRALKRRNHVLDRMAAAGYITANEAGDLKKQPIALKRGLRITATGLYFVEEVRQYVEKRYGAEKLYRSGFKVATTMNRHLQDTAEKAVRHGLHAIDRWRGFRNDLKKLHDGTITEEELADYKHPDWKKPPEADSYRHALVLDVTRERARLRMGEGIEVAIDKKNSKWIWRRGRSVDMRKALHRGDIALLHVETIDPEKGPRVTLSQQPLVQGALIAIEVGTGNIKALVGGYDFDESKFDRATQALRQVGSAFKPIVYTSAIDNGYRQTDMILDAPLRLVDEKTKRVYSPHNYDRRFLGPIPLWKALALSRNVPAVRMLLQVGAKTVVDYARLMGITSPLLPYPSLALGAAEVTPLEIAKAFSVFPNQGVLVEPTLIRHIIDLDGNVIEEHRVKAEPVIRADTAMVMTDMLSGVVKFGTGRRARKLAKALAGKTGTTNDYTDTWFVGFSPNLVLAVWVGFDKKKTLGSRRTGSSVALPIWIEFMKEYLKEHPADAWTEPGSVIHVRIDKTTGLRAGPDCANATVIDRVFQRGTEPERVCTLADHFRAKESAERALAAAAGAETPWPVDGEPLQPAIP